MYPDPAVATCTAGQRRFARAAVGGAAGDPAGADDQFRILYDRHGSAIRRHVMRMIGDPGQAEDVLQETMIRAWRAIPTHPPESEVTRCWLLRIARNLAIDRIRARRARPIEAGPILDSDHTDSDCADRVVNALYLTRALVSLRPEHRAVLQHVYYYGRSVAETAAILGVPVGTVKSRTFYALRTLRQAIQDEDGRGHSAVDVA